MLNLITTSKEATKATRKKFMAIVNDFKFAK